MRLDGLKCFVRLPVTYPVSWIYGWIQGGSMGYSAVRSITHCPVYLVFSVLVRAELASNDHGPGPLQVHIIAAESQIHYPCRIPVLAQECHACK